MLKSCKYCGRIHDSKFDCGKKPKMMYQRTDKDKFRYSRAWDRKRTEIKERDKYLCQICIRKLYNTLNQFTYDGLEVHHAVKLNEAYEKRLDNDNLLTLCIYHHKMADKGEIPFDVIKKIIKEQEGNSNG